MILLAGAGGQTSLLRAQNPGLIVRLAATALSRGQALTDVALECQATSTAGSTVESGPATLEARGEFDSRIVFNFSGGQRRETRQESKGAWAGPHGLEHPIALHNSLTVANWFFPALTFGTLLRDEVVLSYIGQELRDARGVHHLRIWRSRKVQNASVAEWIERLSAMDVYLDASTYLPVALGFNVHPDDNAAIDLPVEIRYNDYRDVGGFKVPFRIQKLLQNSLVLDLAVTSVKVNPGLPDSDFSITAAGQGGLR